MSKMWLLMKPLSKEDVSKRDEEEKGTPTPLQKLGTYRQDGGASRATIMIKYLIAASG